MKVLWMIISDFKSFRGKHKIDFRQYGPGLYFIRGDNKEEPDLGANGAGKSSLFDALHWCWYGTSIRGTKTTQLVPWQGAKETYVEFAYESTSGEVVKIKRTYKPNGTSVYWGKKGKPVTQDELNDILGMKSDSVQHSIIIGQFSQYFFDLKPRDKLSLLTELLDLDYWIECSRRASETASELRLEKDKVEKRLSALIAIKEKLSEDMADLEEEKEGLVSNQDLQLQTIELVKQISERRSIKRIRIKRQKKLEEAKSEVQLLQRKLSKQEKMAAGWKSTSRELSDKMQIVKAKISMLEKQLSHFTNHTSSYKCSSCGQRVSDQHRRKEIKRIRGLISKAKEEVKGLSLSYKREMEMKEECLGQADSIKDTIDEIDIRGIESSLRDIDLQERSVSKDIVRTKERIADIEDREKHQKDKIDAVYKKIKENGRIIRSRRGEFAELEVALDHASYWAKAFKDVRLFEINDVLTSLQVEINSYLADLGMENWSVIFEIERETKKGSVTRGFRIMVDPGTDSKSIKPWEAWSGGEGQRLRLAGTLSLSNLILRQFNRTSNFQIWDEPFTWLSGSGKDDMLELLQETAYNEGKIIFVIDHNSLDFPFDGFIKVVKDKNGSHIVQ
jgi:DNA repair exonuclease SbcCD ATPase subunit